MRSSMMPGIDNSSQLTRLCSVEPEVEMPRLAALLEEAGVPFLTKHFISQMGVRYGDLGMTTFYVEERDLERAAAMINDAAPPDTQASGNDDLEPWRLERRYRITRLLTYIYSAYLLFMSVPLLSVNPRVSLVLFLLACIFLGLARWSLKAPEEAFGALLLMNAGLVAVAAFAFPEPLLTPGILFVVAVYFAYKTAAQASSSSRLKSGPME